MNVLLINPSQRKIYGKLGGITQPHMGLAYIGAVLEKEGHNVSLLDMDFDKITYEQLGKVVCTRKINMVGITTTTPTISSAIKVARTIKANNPVIKIVAGGVHSTVMARELIRERTIDFIVRGEGEVTIKELAERIANCAETLDVPGLTYSKDGQLIETPQRALIDNLNRLPFPARHLFSNRQYRYPDMLYYSTFAIHTSRGCPYDCSFCQVKELYGKRVRFRSAESVVDEIELLIKKFKAREIHIWDDNFAADKKRVFQIRDEIKRRKISAIFAFPNGIRVDTIRDEKVLRAMRDMGGYAIAFGIESGNQAILDSVGKGITLDQARRAIYLVKEIGFEVWAFFMLGFPDDDGKTLTQTINFAKELDPHIAKFHILKPFPGSEIYKQMKREGLIDDFNYENYGIHTFSVHHTRYISAAKIWDYQKKAYRSFYLRPRILLRHLLRLRSLDRIKNNIKWAFGILKLIVGGRIR